jgi:glycerol-3-phosphate acyltransferase PlsX
VIAVDCNGADLGPAEVAAGAALAAGEGARVLLFGPATELGEMPPGVEVIDAPISIAKTEDPVLAVRSTPQASIVRAAAAVAEGRAQALVCAGGRGAALAQVVLGVSRPRVGLLSNGEEATRGSALVVEAHAELSERAQAGIDAFEFVGNVEGGDVISGRADVIVTDGFTGNIALKLMEGVSQTMLGAVREAAMSSTRAKLGGALLRGALRGFRDEIDPEANGGAYLLGLRCLGVVPHGRFTRTGFAQAILRAERGARADIVAQTHSALEHAGALRRSPMSASGASLRQTG